MQYISVCVEAMQEINGLLEVKLRTICPYIAAIASPSCNISMSQLNTALIHHLSKICFSSKSRIIKHLLIESFKNKGAFSCILTFVI